MNLSNTLVRNVLQLEGKWFGISHEVKGVQVLEQNYSEGIVEVESIAESGYRSKLTFRIFPIVELNCDDGVDNDNNGDGIDCEDSDCSDAPECN